MAVGECLAVRPPPPSRRRRRSVFPTSAVLPCAPAIPPFLSSPLSLPCVAQMAGNIIYWCCSAFFFLEFLLKTFVYRWKYFRDPFNILDFCLIIIEIIAFVSIFVETFDMIGAFRPLRALRLLHLFDHLTLGLRARTMHIAWFSCGPQYALLEGIHFGMIWMYSIFGCTLTFGTSVPATVRYSYSNLLDALITTYALSTGESWPGVLQWVVETQGTWLSIKVVLWIAAVVLSGSYLLPALFFAVQVGDACDQRCIGMPDNHRRKTPPLPPAPLTHSPPSLLLFQCMIHPRDFQCDFLEKSSLWPSGANFLWHSDNFTLTL